MKAGGSQERCQKRDRAGFQCVFVVGHDGDHWTSVYGPLAPLCCGKPSHSQARDERCMRTPRHEGPHASVYGVWGEIPG